MDPNIELIPDSLLAERRSALTKQFEAAAVDVAVVYGDVASADELQYFANLGPYWGSATCVLDKDGSRKLITGMTARVNFWVSMMSRVPQDDILGVGPKVNSTLASYLSEKYPAGSVVGMVGPYFPEDMRAAIEGAGFKVVFMNDIGEKLLDKRDDAYRTNLLKGIELMSSAISSGLKGAGEDGRTMQRVAVDVEYACRTAGAMDTLILAADKDLVFSKAEERKADSAWTLYMQLQYLGDWMIISRNTDPTLNQKAFAVRDKIIAGLNPRPIERSFESDGWEVSITRQARSDQLSSAVEGSIQLLPGQVIGMRLRQRKSGVLIDDMVLVTDTAARLLTVDC